MFESKVCRHEDLCQLKVSVTMKWQFYTVTPITSAMDRYLS